MNLLKRVIQDYPMIDFHSCDNFCWSPKKQQICFNKNSLANNKGNWTLLHELGHAIAGHNNYIYDLELIEIESSAWTIAQELAETYNIQIDQNYIQNCLDSYRDWLHLRSTCPKCNFLNIQITPIIYRCINCEHHWQVSSSKLCRPYRLTYKNKTTPLPV